MLQGELIEAAFEQGKPESALGPALMALKPGLPEAEEAATELGGILANAWNNFQMAGVVSLMELLKKQGVDDDVLKQVRKPLAGSFKIAQTWAKKLGDMQLERNARWLRWTTRRNEISKATEYAVTYLKLQGGKESERALKSLGSVLGTVENDQPAAHKVRKKVASEVGLSSAESEVIAEAMQKRMDAAMGGVSQNREREFSTAVTEATLFLKNKLPTRLEKDRAAEKRAEFEAEIRGLVAVGFRFSEKDYWPDIEKLLVEFLPKAASQTAETAGVEPRQYEALEPEGKKAVLRTFKALGENDRLAQHFLARAKEVVNDGEKNELRNLIDFLGALRNEVAAPFIIDVLEDTKDSKLRETAVFALGNIASPAALKTLLVLFKDRTGKRSLNRDDRDAAGEVLEALGKITRNPKAPDEVRGRLFDKVRELMPRDDKRLAAAACSELLAPKILGDLDPATRRWAVDALIDHLWLPVQQVSFASAPSGSISALGPRQKSADMLVLLAEYELDMILEEASRRSMNVSGGMMAIGEVFAKLKEPRAIPTLTTMVRAAASSGANEPNSYTSESMFDAASQSYVELEPEKIVTSLVFAIKETAEDELERNEPGPACIAAADLYQAAKDGDFPNMGQEASGFLFDLYAKLPENLKQDGVSTATFTPPSAVGAAAASGSSPFGDPSAGSVPDFQRIPSAAERLAAIPSQPGGGTAQDAAASSDGEELAPGDPLADRQYASTMEQPAIAATRAVPAFGEEHSMVQSVSPSRQKELLKVIEKGGGFFGKSKKREERIAAMVQLSRAQVLEALPRFIELLEDKDAMVAASAGTALNEYTKNSAPPKTVELALLELCDALSNAPAKRQRVMREALGQMNLQRKGCRDALRRILVARGGDPGLLYELSQVMNISRDEAETLLLGKKKQAEPKPGAGEGAEGGSQDGDGPIAPFSEVPIAGMKKATGGGVASGALDAKRAYMEARRAWIAAGKPAGQEPKPPV